MAVAHIRLRPLAQNYLNVPHVSPYLCVLYHIAPVSILIGTLVN